MKIRGLSKRGEYFYYRPPQIDGIRPKRIALRTKDPEEAIEMAFNLHRRQLAHAGSERLSGEIERFLAAKRDTGDYTRKTCLVTQSTLRIFCEWADNPRTADVTGNMIEAWRKHLAREGRSSNGMVTYLRRVQSLFSWLVQRDRMVRSPFDDVKIPKVRRSKAVSFCTREQRDLLVQNCEREDLRFVLMAGFFLGFRRMEISEAISGWFRTPGICEVSRTATYLPKDKERRVIHYGQRFSEFLENYGLRKPFMLRPEVEHKKSLYRYDPRRPFEKYVREQGLPWVTMHTMRHTFATLHIQAGTPLATVADWLGDGYDVTYKHYAAYAPTDVHVRNID